MKNKTNNNTLRYEFYRNCRDIIIIDLKNGYSVIAIKMLNRSENDYIVEFYLKNNNVDRWDLIEEAENVKFFSDYKTINCDILRYTAAKNNLGFFDYYINRYEYELKCFEIGNDIVERKRLGLDNR